MAFIGIGLYVGMIIQSFQANLLFSSRIIRLVYMILTLHFSLQNGHLAEDITKDSCHLMSRDHASRQKSSNESLKLQLYTSNL
jgi:hypothetical protein